MQTFTPIAQGTSLLNLDNTQILIDCAESPPAKLIPHLILLTHPNNVLSLPEFYAQTNPKPTIIATLPVINLGRITCLEHNIPANLVDSVFDDIRNIKFAENTIFNGISITAYSAGHSLGGSIWHLTKEHESAIIAINWNHSKESLLPACGLYVDGIIPEHLKRPGVLITDARNSRIILPPRRGRERTILELLDSTIEAGGDVLIPIDPGTRLLELLFFLDKSERKFPVVFLSKNGSRVLAYAKSMLEYMKDVNPEDLEFKNINAVSDLSSLDEIKGNKVVIATLEDISDLSADVLHSLSPDPKNLLLLISRSQDTDYGIQLSETPIQANTTKQITFTRRVPLTGAELAVHQQAEAERKRLLLETQLLEQRNLEILEADSESEDEDEELLNPLGEFSKSFDKHRSAGPLKFPYLEKRRRFDDYGEIIRSEEFVRHEIEETSTAIKFKQGEKRKWEEVQEVPVKLVLETSSVDLRLRIAMVDFEGIHDERSLKMILPMVNPRKLILCRASREEIDALEVDGLRDVFRPLDGQTVDVSGEITSWSVNLDDNILVNWQRFEQFSISPLSAILSLSSQPPVLQQSPINASGPAMFVGDVRLPVLRRGLLSDGFQAEFSGDGTIIADGEVIVRKEDQGRVVIEGVGGRRKFWDVRKLVYEGLAGV
ncbi:Cleavage factor two protein 2 [Neolecta irregularis DAH-3]|uniref:Cleavage and polyadenylation specificity factor subunit 2 n=1 Tax=Neolecta irregularis (strain DAH-3) TaxID=1198029 RepID=A0A1U7LUW4_NEOID|nr:Cleavage factor two protein 2 [Neolecta irregularis DAH-3]|eukprot:OLL26408.1 Cleavage factor two protein 2 [Neolecta irregularis DAH-3]